MGQATLTISTNFFVSSYNLIVKALALMLLLVLWLSLAPAQIRRLTEADKAQWEKEFEKKPLYLRYIRPRGPPFPKDTWLLVPLKGMYANLNIERLDESTMVVAVRYWEPLHTIYPAVVVVRDSVSKKVLWWGAVPSSNKHSISATLSIPPRKGDGSSVGYSRTFYLPSKGAVILELNYRGEQYRSTPILF